MGDRDGDGSCLPVENDVVGTEGRKVDAGFQVGRAAEEDLPVADLVPRAFVIGLDDFPDPVFDEPQLFHRGNGLDLALHGILYALAAAAS